MDNKVYEALDFFGAGLKRDQKDLSQFKMVKNNSISYSDRHRGQWHRSDYSFGDIQRAQDVDSMLAKAIELKASKFLLAGWEFVSQNSKTVEYIKQRIQQIEIATGIPFPQLMYQTVQDLIRYNNAMWTIVRDPINSGGKVVKVNGVELDPIAGIFMLPLETLEFKTKPNGNIERVRQIVPGSPIFPEFQGRDLIHFWTNKRPGFVVGTPVLFSVLEDISLLRSLEQNVEELIQCNLFPIFHYKIGTDKYPARVNHKTGLTEQETIAQTLEYMPSSGVYISDWRTEISAIGSEGRALRIDYYLEYFKKRVFTGLGVSPTDFGQGGDANRSTAQTQSKALTESIQSLQKTVKSFIDFLFIRPLLQEGLFNFDPFTPENLVEIKFGKIDTAEQVLLDNSNTQLWLNNILTHEEVRIRVGERPLKAEQEMRLNARLFPSAIPAPATLPGAPGSAMSENQSGIKPKIPSKVKDERGYLLDDLTNRWEFLKSQIVLFTNGNSPGDVTKKLIETWADSTTERLYVLLKDRFNTGFNSTGLDRWDYNLDGQTLILKDFASFLINNLSKSLIQKIDSLHNQGVTISTIFDSLNWRVNLIQKDILSKSYNYGRAIAFFLEEDASIKLCCVDESCEECKKHHGVIIDRTNFNFNHLPPGIKYGHPGCKCTVEKNE